MKCKNRRDRPRSLRPRSLSPARKNTLGKSARSVKRGGAARLGAAECSANDRRPFKSRRLKSFSTRGSGKHRHGFSSTFQTPAAAAAAAAAAALLAPARVTYEHRAIPRNLYGRYSRRFHYFQPRCREYPTRRITCSTRSGKTAGVIKRRRADPSTASRLVRKRARFEIHRAR